MPSFEIGDRVKITAAGRGLEGVFRIETRSIEDGRIEYLLDGIGGSFVTHELDLIISNAELVFIAARMAVGNYWDEAMDAFIEGYHAARKWHVDGDDEDVIRRLVKEALK